MLESVPSREVNLFDAHLLRNVRSFFQTLYRPCMEYYGEITSVYETCIDFTRVFHPKRNGAEKTMTKPAFRWKKVLRKIGTKLDGLMYKYSVFLFTEF